MSPRDPDATVILGAGAVGLFAALAAARERAVIVVPRRSFPFAKPRIDAVPVAFLGLLVEFGIHPSEIGVDDVHDDRLIAWSSLQPVMVKGRATAHLDRGLLDAALLARVRAHRWITVAADGAPPPRTTGRVLDATGRRAISAETRTTPPEPLVAHTYLVRGSFTPAQQAFRIACVADGYVYRLGTRRAITVGVVRRATRRCAADAVAQPMAHAAWLAEGLALDALVPAGRGGHASVQWAVGGGPELRIGDAALARDALASQGLANGASDALRVLNGQPSSERPAWLRLQRLAHLEALDRAMTECHCSDTAFWSTYRAFVRHAITEDLRAAPSDRHPSPFAALDAS